MDTGTDAAVGGDVSEITGMTFVGDTGWACGYVAALPAGQDIQDDTLSSYGSPMLWSYHADGWTLYQQKWPCGAPLTLQNCTLREGRSCIHNGPDKHDEARSSESRLWVTRCATLKADFLDAIHGTWRDFLLS